MTVYVDDMMAKYGRMIMCHMIADTDEELHAMADIIGVNRRWWQAPPKHHSHYDVSLGARDKAIAAGARTITMREAAKMCRRRKVEGIMGTPEESHDWFTSYQERMQDAKSDSR